jgi:hypothetical protein
MASPEAGEKVTGTQQQVRQHITCNERVC